MGKADDKNVVDGYFFSSSTEYARAAKEKETIEYLMANTDMTDMKSVLKIYNRAVEKKSFRTVVGLEFIRNIRNRLVASGIASDDDLRAVPVPPPAGGARAAKDAAQAEGDAAAKAQAEKYKLAYENAATGKTIRNIIIVFLAIIIIAIMAISYNGKYSIFTFFTDYKSEMENELLDKYESWETQLEEREKELDEREAALDGAASSDGGASAPPAR